MQGGIERSIAHLQDVAGDLFQALANRPAVERLQRQNLQQKQVQGSLDQVGWSAHDRSSRLPSYHTPAPLGKQEENWLRALLAASTVLIHNLP